MPSIAKKTSIVASICEMSTDPKQHSDRYERLNDLMIHFISKIEMTSLHYA